MSAIVDRSANIIPEVLPHLTKEPQGVEAYGHFSAMLSTKPILKIPRLRFNQVNISSISNTNPFSN
ncbi:hypothetical protein NC653_039249 [Populus alba x Populus x berolinensis]|uniref:Uncharacterized protein n=1 Tax=Populus alba x Populus x berolinensis TaxID=444605 RepID=A0AAD6LAR5_9ROSI|nr:hypothetical protein NC653_039249 [Populus alba x Populus x berolinensis]